MRGSLSAPQFGKPIPVLYVACLPILSWTVFDRCDMYPQFETAIALHTDPRIAYEAEFSLPEHGMRSKSPIAKTIDERQTDIEFWRSTSVGKVA